MSFFSCFQGSVVAAEHLEIILENLLKVLLDSASRLGDSLYPPSPMYIYHKLTHNKLSKSPENPQLAQREVVSSTDSLHLQTAESIPVQSIAPQARPLLAIQRAYGRQRPPLQCLQPPQQTWPQPPPAPARRRRRRPRRRAPCPQPPASPPQARRWPSAVNRRAAARACPIWRTGWRAAWLRARAWAAR